MKTRYLQRIGNRWYVRVKVPRVLQGRLRNTHIRRTLETGDLAEANRRKWLVIATIRQEFDRLQGLSPNQQGVATCSSPAVAPAEEPHRYQPRPLPPSLIGQLATSRETLDELLGRWLSTVDYLNQTKQQHRRAYQEFRLFFGGDRTPEAVTPQVALEYVERRLRPSSQAYNTKRRKLDSLGVFWEWLASQQLVLDSLSHFRRLPGGMASIKQHAGVQVPYACDAGGRSTLSKQLQEERTPWFIEKLVRLIRSKPDETFLIVTYRSRGPEADFERRIRSALASAGIDANCEIRSPIDGTSAPRIALMTWGHETGTNQLSTYNNVVLLGVYRKPEESVAGAYLGQVDDLRHPQMKVMVRSLVEAEAHHAILQAVNRIRMRRVEVRDNLTQALPCNVYILHKSSGLERALRIVLPGCPPWVPWREECESANVTAVAMAIRAKLEDLEMFSEGRISCRALRKALSMDVSSTTFRRARDEALAESRGWYLDGASLHRLSFA